MSTQTGHDPLQQSDFNNLSKVDVGPLYSSLLDKTCCKERERESWWGRDLKQFKQKLPVSVQTCINYI